MDPTPLKLRRASKTDIPGTFSARGGSALGGNATSGATLGPVNETNMTRIWNKHKQTYFDYAQDKNTPRGEQSRRVLVGMSGGVDSSVSAALLLEQGYEVIGAFMKNWSDGTDEIPPSAALQGPSGSSSYGQSRPPSPDSTRLASGVFRQSRKDCDDGSFQECGWRDERRDAMRVAAQLGIPFVTLDFEKHYREDVVEHMFREFAAGRTPNPDVMCNRFIKFDRFVKAADELGCDFVATGHYARVEKATGEAGGTEGEYRILMGSDPNKDQTYFLWAMPSVVLSRVLFPVGAMLKSEVREKARTLGLSVADKKDSMGICFVGEVNMREFLKERIAEEAGEIITTDGRVVGTHEGLPFYTIGQRHGLNVGGGTPYYVVEKKPETKQLVVSSNFHPALFKKELTAIDLNWFRRLYSLSEATVSPSTSSGDNGGGVEGTLRFRCQARIRYRQPLASCTVTVRPPFQGGQSREPGSRFAGQGVHVVFDEHQRAVTPGQSVVFYQGEEMLGGGIIE